MVEIKGIEKMTLVDYPGKVASTLFLPNCNFRCHYCHNPDLVLRPHTLKTIDEKELMNYLESKKKWIDGICITGGEPTIHKDLPEFIAKFKEKGFSVKLDTNGTNPEMLNLLIEKKLVDCIAMDIKAPLEKYDEVTGVTVNKESIKKSVELLKKSKIDCEFRTTVCPGMLDEKDMDTIGIWLKGEKKYFLQGFVPSAHIKEELKKTPATSKKELKKLAFVANKHIMCDIR